MVSMAQLSVAGMLATGDNLSVTIVDITSAWTGLHDFAQWIVRDRLPQVVVDLGVDHGFSTAAFATPRIGHVYGIDSRADSITSVTKNIDSLGLLDMVTLVQSDFTEASKLWSRQIDILHVDGDHSYESVLRDFSNWSTHVTPGGIILFHDIDSFPEGPGKLFREIAWPKWGYNMFCGLGVVTKPR